MKSHTKTSSPPRSATPDDIILVAHMVRRMRAGGDLRRSMVRRIRSAIQNGEYENPLKLEIAAERFAGDLTLPRQQSADG